MAFRGLINVEWINTMISSLISSSVPALVTSQVGSPVSYPVVNDEYTTAGGAAAEAITVTGALATDHLQVTLVDDGTSNVTVKTAKITDADEVTVTFSADPGDDAIVSILVTRDV